MLERARQSSDPEQYRRLVERFPGTAAAEEGKDELAQLLIAEATRAHAAGDATLAETRAEEARLLGGLTSTTSARALQMKLDEERAEAVARSVAEAPGCAEALALVAGPLRKKPRPHFRDRLREKTRDPLLGCLTATFETLVAEGKTADARTLLRAADVTTALSEAGRQLADRALTKVVVLHAAKDMRPLLEAKRFADAATKLQELASGGVLAKDEVPLARELLQETLAKHLVQLSEGALTEKKPEELLGRFDEELGLGQFGKIPPALSRARDRLRVAVECARRRCRVEKPRAEWAWGKLAVASPKGVDEPAGQDVPHGSQVWVLARGQGHALVLSADPGTKSGAELLDVVQGWVPAASLRKADTRETLPPTAELAGVRVWGPLRPPAKDYHLGTVVKVDGTQVAVKRFSDNTEVSVALNTIRFGTLADGVRVLAFCTDALKTEPARITGLIAAGGGPPRVKVACENGDVNKVEVAGSLVSKREWLR